MGKMSNMSQEELSSGLRTVQQVGLSIFFKFSVEYSSYKKLLTVKFQGLEALKEENATVQATLEAAIRGNLTMKRWFTDFFRDES